MVEITILQEGYGFTDEQKVYHASATCTLLKCDHFNVIIDPGGAWEKEKILQSLREQKLDTSDIDVVVATHGHSDHVGNLNLFSRAKQIVGFDINNGDVYEENGLNNETPYVLVKDQIEVIATPGHMHHDVSVVVFNVESLGTVGVVGDLFECEDDEEMWRSISESIEQQQKYRMKIRKLCDYIVPGHGRMFENKFKKDF